MALKPTQLHELAAAFAQIVVAVKTPNPAAMLPAHEQAEVLGELVVLGLAQRGFVVTFDPPRAAFVAAEMEREDGARPT